MVGRNSPHSHSAKLPLQDRLLGHCAPLYGFYILGVPLAKFLSSQKLIFFIFEISQDSFKD